MNDTVPEAEPQYEDIDRHEMPQGLRFEISVDGATAADNERGVQFANEFFKEVKVSPYAAAWAYHYMTMESDDHPLSEEQRSWGCMFMDIERLAINAVCSNMPKGTEAAYDFGITWDDEVKYEPTGTIVRPTHVVGRGW